MRTVLLAICVIGAASHVTSDSATCILGGCSPTAITFTEEAAGTDLIYYLVPVPCSTPGNVYKAAFESSGLPSNPVWAFVYSYTDATTGKKYWMSGASPGNTTVVCQPTVNPFRVQDDAQRIENVTGTWETYTRAADGSCSWVSAAVAATCGCPALQYDGCGPDPTPTPTPGLGAVETSTATSSTGGLTDGQSRVLYACLGLLSLLTLMAIAYAFIIEPKGPGHHRV